MRTLIGIPAFRIPGLLRRCLNALVDAPALPGWDKPTILVVDNASDPDVKALLRNEFQGRVRTWVLPENTWCNGGWHWAMLHGLVGNYDLIGLGSSDVVLPPHWYETITQRAEQFHDEVWVPAIGDPVENPDYRNAEHVTGGVAGFFSFLPRKAVELVYPIPPTLKHWFGDQYMFTKLRDAGWHITIMHDVKSLHEQSAVSAANPLTAGVIEQDKLAWQELEAAKSFEQDESTRRTEHQEDLHELF